MGEAGPEFIEKFLHDFGSTFHEGIIEHKKLQERFEDLEELISKVENENT